MAARDHARGRYEADDDQSQADGRRAGQCVGWGCPLAGTISGDSGGSKKSWFCRFHWGTPSDDWHAITGRIRAFLDDTRRYGFSQRQRMDWLSTDGVRSHMRTGADLPEDIEQQLRRAA